MDKFLKGVGLFVLGVAAIFYQLFVFTKIWLYVAVPMGLPEIGLMKAWGIDLLLGTLLPAQNSSKRETEEIVVSVLYKMVSLSVGWGLAYWFFA